MGGDGEGREGKGRGGEGRGREGKGRKGKGRKGREERRGEERRGEERKGKESREQEEGWQTNHSLPAGTRFQGSGLTWSEDREAPAEESSFTLSSTVFFMAAGEMVSWSAMVCSSLEKQ
jgi:hypothetical protein